MFLLVAAAVLGVAGLRWAHFVGASDSGRVAIYQGVPLDLGAGLRLYQQVDTSPVLVATLSQEERAALFDHELVSLGEAQRRVGCIAATRHVERIDPHGWGPRRVDRAARQAAQPRLFTLML